MKKYLHILITLLLLANSLVAPLQLMAQEVPNVPTAPVPPSVPSVPTAPNAPEVPLAPNNPIAPSPIVTEAPTPKPTRTPRPENTPTPVEPNVSVTPVPTNSPSDSQNSVNPSPTPIQSPTDGDTRIITGDATTDGSIITTANDNGAIVPLPSSSVDGVSVTQNGSDSNNTATISDANTNNTVQDNSAVVNNNLDLGAQTGANDNSGNLGETLIKTGDANVSGTVVTSVNTNVDGLVISQFDIADDHVGDIVLDFGAQCITCSTSGEATAITSGNGAGSNNTTNLVDSNVAGTFQTNEATLGNTLTLDANSGLNNANSNTGGDSVIYTGDANVNANMVTMANNNIAGNVVYGVVNIYGDLVGDIIFPEEQLESCCTTTGTSSTTTKNGTNSNNTTNATSTNTELTFQTNDANINNTLNLNGETGNNNVSSNTGGDSRIITGDAEVVANVVTVANTNLDAGNMWLVIVNEAGQWIGKILGTNSGSNMAASEGTTLTTNEFGEVVATNGNGNGSNNTTNTSANNTTTTVQSNSANINNTMNLSANTGGNSASKNTGGESNIVTGDATIIANMVNFVNNNITGGGKLFVTVVNVFGSWIGDFVTPGQHKEQTQPENTSTSTANVVEKKNNEVVQTNNSVTTNDNSVSGSNSNKQLVTKPSMNVRFNRDLLGATNTTSGSDVEFTTQDTTESFDAPEATITPIVAGKRIVSINLAWLIFMIPGGILLLIVRSLVKKNRRLHQ